VIQILDERCRYDSFDTFPDVFKRIEVGRVWWKINQFDVLLQGKLHSLVRMMGPEIIQDDQEVLPRILFPDTAEKGTDILLPGVLPEVDYRGPVECIEPEGVRSKLGRVLRDYRSCERPEPLAVCRGLGRGLIQEPDHYITSYQSEFFLGSPLHSEGGDDHEERVSHTASRTSLGLSEPASACTQYRTPFG